MICVTCSQIMSAKQSKIHRKVAWHVVSKIFFLQFITKSSAIKTCAMSQSPTFDVHGSVVNTRLGSAVTSVSCMSRPENSRTAEFLSRYALPV